MQLPIFPRFVASYFFIFILVLALSVFSIFQLRQFDQVTQSILGIDNQLLQYGKKLSDSLLSQMRYERKYMISREQALYQQFLRARDEFGRDVAQVSRILERSDQLQKDVLKGLEAHYQTYQKLVEEEAGHIQAKVRYHPQWYREEKEKAVDRVLDDLDALAENSQMSTFRKIRALEKAGTDASHVAIGMAAVTLLGIITISYFITRSITRPISALIEKTRDIARGVFKEDLRVSSPPEIKELAESFNAMCARLRALDRMKSDFFATMSHELRTPLSAIKEGTNLLLEGIGGEIGEKQRKILNIMSGESKRLIDLVNSSLDFSKMEAGMMVFNFAPTDILPLIHQAVAAINPLAISKKIRIQTESQPRLPLIRMDGERILQALRNILGNAVKFTPEGGQITVSAQTGKGNLEVRVIDTGCGIPPENLSSIFEKFCQVPLNGASRIKGTGLGLAIVKHIITAHGGKVWAESETGRGTSIIFVLPA